MNQSTHWVGFYAQALSSKAKPIAELGSTPFQIIGASKLARTVRLPMKLGFGGFRNSLFRLPITNCTKGKISAFDS